MKKDNNLYLFVLGTLLEIIERQKFFKSCPQYQKKQGLRQGTLLRSIQRYKPPLFTFLGE